MNGISETFTSPNHPDNYGSGDSKRWVFCVGIFISNIILKNNGSKKKCILIHIIVTTDTAKVTILQLALHLQHHFASVDFTCITLHSSIQAVDPNDHIQISCSDFDVGGFFFECTDDTVTISNVDSKMQVTRSSF